MLSTARTPGFTLLVIGLLLTASVLLSRRPYYNWDMFPYMALVLEDDQVPFDSTHLRVFREARNSMPGDDFDAISARQPVLLRDAGAFQDILPYFRIKPGYIVTIRTLHAAGLPPLMATWLPSIVSFFLLGLALCLWACTLAPARAAALFTFVVAFSPPMISLARYSSPDMLCAMVSAVGLMGVLGTRLHFGLGLLLTAIALRPDAVLLFLPVLAALRWAGRVSWATTMAWFAGALLIILLAFQGTEVLTELTFAQLHWDDRAALYLASADSLIRSYTLPLVIVAVVLLFLRRGPGQPDMVSLMLYASLISIIMRFLLHPFVEDRFHLPAYLLILMAGWITVSTRLFQPVTGKS